MKQLSLLLFTLLFALTLQAQESKSITVTPGKLWDAILPAERNTIISLTVSGTMDARDFRTLRDAMPALAFLYLDEVVIAAYTGTDGTYFSPANFSYPANDIPDYSFYQKPTLRWVSLPSTIISIGHNAFGYCTALTSLSIPSTVEQIGKDAFMDCSALTSVTLPPNLKRIRSKTFYHCSALTSIEIPSSVISIEESAFVGCRALQFVYIPTSVTSIGVGSFSYCTSLTSIVISSSVASIGDWAFYANDALRTVYVHAGVPVDLSQGKGVFPLYYNHFSKLIVPYGSRARYITSPLWKEFNSIEESDSGIAIDANYLKYDAATYNYSFGISANVDWTIRTDQSWLSVDTPSGSDDHSVTITIEANPTLYRRRGQVTVSPATEGIAQVITIVQEGAAKILTLTPGSLLSSLTEKELNGITTLTLEGTMDARDFKTLRDRMPLLTTLDMSRASVVAYAGPGGATPIQDDPNPTYKADKIPPYAFSNPYDNYPFVKYVDEYKSKDKWKTIILPASITAIGRYAFVGCEGLTAMEIPEGVEKIDDFAFKYCDRLTSVTLPSTLLMLGRGAFEDCFGLKKVVSKSATPPVIQPEPLVFYGVKKNNINLYVPAGSKELYKAAYEWKDFIYIIEMNPVSADLHLTGGNFTLYPNPFTQQLSIEGSNPLLEAVSVDIYSISGQKIRTLARALKGQRISIVWDGDDETGRQVPKGIYLLKMNGETMKVVKR